MNKTNKDYENKNLQYHSKKYYDQSGRELSINKKNKNEIEVSEMDLKGVAECNEQT